MARKKAPVSTPERLPARPAANASVRALIGAIVEFATSMEQADPSQVESDALGKKTLEALSKLVVVSIWGKDQVRVAQAAGLAVALADSLAKAYREQKRLGIGSALRSRHLIMSQLKKDRLEWVHSKGKLLLPLDHPFKESIRSLRGAREAADQVAARHLGISRRQLQEQRAGRARTTDAMWFGVELTEGDIASYLVSLFDIDPSDTARIAAEIMSAVDQREAAVSEARRTGHFPGRRKAPWLMR